MENMILDPQARQKLCIQKGNIVIILCKSTLNYLIVYNEILISFRVFTSILTRAPQRVNIIFFLNVKTILRV